MKKVIRIFGIILACVIVLLLALLQRIDRTPYIETAHYKKWKEWLSNKEFEQTSGAFQVSWAKKNITPTSPGPMAGYGNRWGKHFEAVLDSLYVRVIAVRNPTDTVYLLSADMLIVPPNVTQRLETLLAKENISISNVHLGATHTHHSLGGWGEKLTGRLFGGKYNVEVEKRLAETFRDAILLSQQDFVETNIIYSESKNENNIRYRLKTDGGVIDPLIRSLVFERIDGKQAELITYAAHPTVLDARFMQISRDYPGILVDSLESIGNDFAMYMAGAVGSMGSNAYGDEAIDRAHAMVDGLISELKDSVITQMSPTLTSDYFEIPMPAQTARISINYALRPWVFKTFFGNYPTMIKVTKIGKTLLLGMPADFSGEIMSELDAYADEKGVELIITSFNGSYNGYITPDKLYEKDLYETVIMSWNGYQSGGYFTQIGKDIIDKFYRDQS